MSRLLALCAAALAAAALLATSPSITKPQARAAVCALKPALCVAVRQ